MPENDLEHYRAALLMLARAQLARHRNLGLDASDLVQRTYVDACRDREQFREGTPEQLFAWLRKVLHNNFLDAYDHARAGKRDAARQALEADLTGSFVGLDDLLTAGHTSPSEATQRNEELVRLSEALERLPAQQREAIVLKDLAGLTLRETSERLGCTEAATAGLLFRGRKELRRQLTGK
jgi:RNA polymerase sigma-70 factor (ECF subfamily)